MALSDDILYVATQSVLNSTGVTVIMGAGVSVAAGIPAFRGDNGLYNGKFNGVNHKDLMSIEALKPPRSSDHLKFMSMLAKKAISAEPTQFHQLLRVLEENGKLKRIYTQNIDGLEGKVGFDTLGSVGPSARCIPLHGCVLQLRCNMCSTRRPLEPYLDELDTGSFPPCDICKKDSEERVRKGARRRTGAAVLRPDIVLYDETVSEEVSIVECGISDVKKVSKSHVLLVVGTTLKIEGIKTIFKNIAARVRANDGQVIYLDLEKPPKQLEKFFTLHVQGDCQVFSKGMIAAIEEAMPEGVEKDGFEALSRYTRPESRRDLRPLWDWV